MKDADLQPLFKEWAADKLGIYASQIEEVDFGTIYGGYCETCQYTTFGAIVTMNNGSIQEIENYDATEVIGELLRMKDGN